MLNHQKSPIIELRKNNMKFMILIVLACLMCGCTQESEYTEVGIPPNATNIQHLGKGWATFELTISGKNRIFLFYRNNYHASITELVQNDR